MTQAEADPSPPLLSTADVVELLGVDAAIVYRLVDTGELPAYRIGPALRFRRREVDAYLAHRQQPPG